MTSFCANENSKLCNDCGHWAECPECGVCGLCRLYDPPSEQRTYCLKHYRQTFPGKGCDMCEMEARIEALESQNKQLLERRDTEYLRMLEWRGIDGIENACERCGGSGTAVYGSTSTWRGGAGGQMITSDICDRCWGSGDKSNKWTNLRRLPRLQPPEREGE